MSRHTDPRGDMAGGLGGGVLAQEDPNEGREGDRAGPKAPRQPLQLSLCFFLCNVDSPPSIRWEPNEMTLGATLCPSCTNNQPWVTEGSLFALVLDALPP